MIPIQFPQVTHTFRRPEEIPDELCGDLPVAVVLQEDLVTPLLVYCWKPNYEDIEAIKNGKPIYLIVMSSVHPPIEITTESPFENE